MAQVRSCYDEGLARRPNLAGRVTVAFTIAPDGHVGESVVADDTTGDGVVASCIARAAGTWVYPQPDPAGVVAVRYPFDLAPTPAPPPASARSSRKRNAKYEASPEANAQSGLKPQYSIIDIVESGAMFVNPSTSQFSTM